MTKKLLIIIPCYNESASIASLLHEIRQLHIPNYTTDVAVVNDGSTDDTAAIARRAGVHVIDLSVNIGIGGAMQTGFRYAHKNNYDLAVQMDGDGQHPPSELVKLLSHYDATSANVVIGSRFIDKQEYQSTRIRKGGIQYLYWVNRILTGRKIYDCTSGYRLMDREVLGMAAERYPDDYPEPESLITFARRGATISEVPVMMKQRQGGRSSIRNLSTAYYGLKVTIAVFFSYLRK